MTDSNVTPDGKNGHHPILELLPIAVLVGIATIFLFIVGGVSFEKAALAAPVMMIMWAVLTAGIIASEYIHE